MEKRSQHTPLNMLDRGTLFAIAVLASTPVAYAGGVDATHARIETASLALPASPDKACWARYSVTVGAASSTGVIEEVAFRVPCPENVTEVFVASLQRALQVRDYYHGPITGRPDSATRDAVRAFQRANGFDSPILTLETAQKLGLSPRDFGQN